MQFFTRPQTRQLILGAATDYSWEKLDPFLTSLQRQRFEGEVILLTNGTLGNTVPERFDYRILLVRLEESMRLLPPQLLFKKPVIRLCRAFASIAASEGMRRIMAAVHLAGLSLVGDVSLVRYLHYLRIVESAPRGARVIACDTRDVVFQAHPFDEEWPGSLVFALEGTDALISSCAWTSKWYRSAYGDEQLSKDGWRRVSCAGTTMGTRESFIEYLTAMRAEILRLSPANRAVCGIDQGLHNYVVYNGAFGDATFSENGVGPICTLSYEKPPRFMPGVDGVVRNDDGTPVMLVHQYDRRPDIAEIVETRFRSGTGKS